MLKCIILIATLMAAVAATTRDDAYWRRFLKDLCPPAKASIVNEVAKELNSVIERYDLRFVLWFALRLALFFFPQVSL